MKIQNNPVFDAPSKALGGSGSTLLLARADRARDMRAWDDAVSLYHQFLKEEPDRADIWVQLGHATKESSRHEEAHAAYLRALEIAPNVADTHLQLGHLLKLMGEADSAIESYQRAFELDPRLADAKRELLRLGVDRNDLTEFISLSFESTKTRLLIDLSDIFFYLQHHDTVSGIQRVQLGIAEAILRTQAANEFHVVFLTKSDDEGGYIEIEPDYLIQLANELKKLKVNHERLKELARTAGENGYSYTCRKGDIFVMLGAFWVLPNVIERAVYLKDQGITVGVLIYDIIPITHQEYCDTSLTETFHMFFHNVISISDFILTISDHTKNEVSRYIKSAGIAETPIVTVHLAHQTLAARATTQKLSKRVSDIIAEPYVLYVSTIEIRKNHTFLFRIWKMLQQAGDVAVPRLVFVGRPGWRVSDLMDQINSTRGLEGRIRLIHGLSDMELAELYRHAQFTVFPSFEEGWGLPVGESLIFGRPCVASKSSSIPEVGGEFVDYVDPYNTTDGYKVIRRFIVDDTFRERRAQRIQNEFRPRLWNDVASDLVSAISAITQRRDFRPRGLVRPALEPGKIYKIGHDNDQRRFIQSGAGRQAHLIFDVNWYPVESFGRWLRGRSGRVIFQTDSCGNGCAPSAIVILITFQAPAWIEANPVVVSAGQQPLGSFDLAPGAEKRVLFTCPTQGALVDIRFEVRGAVRSGDDSRPDLCLGVKALGYAPVTDALARVSLLEASVTMLPSFATLTPATTLDNESADWSKAKSG